MKYHEEEVFMKDEKGNVRRIKEMEEILDKSDELFKQLGNILDMIEDNIANYRKLDNYYSSKYWFEDEKSYSKGELPEDLRCGVLSEDLAYNLFGENQDLAIRMIEIATKMLKRE